MTITLSDLIAAMGGEIVGKVRLQKVVFLLDQLGLNSGFGYSYHHYGPYSSELSDEIDFEVMFGDISEVQKNRLSDGVPYTVFRSSRSFDSVKSVGSLSPLDLRRFASVITKYSATELELAATAYWLAVFEGFEDWRAELKRRKGIKTEAGRADKAADLLEEIGLNI